MAQNSGSKAIPGETVMVSLVSRSFKLIVVCATLAVAGFAAAQTSPGSRSFQFSPAPPADSPTISQVQATQPLPAAPPASPPAAAPLLALPPATTIAPAAATTITTPPAALLPPATQPVPFQPVASAQAAISVQPLAVAAVAPQAATAPAPAPATTAAAAPPAVELVDMDSLKKVLGPEMVKAAEILGVIWGTPIVTDSTKKPVVTVGTLSSGIVLMGLGYIAAGMISRWMGAKLLTRFGLSKSGVAPIQSIAFYALLATFGMLSLNVLNVPLTVFNFLGGALAIGAGFGSQNIVNNFISGLILLAERPIRVGDVIQLEDWTGTVMQIGARSTKIATGANHEIIVPNSKLLETTVANWTLSDDTVGCTINIGAAYGSPTREVQRLLLLAAQQHAQILKDPAPQVVFADFAADSLLFQLKIWVNLRASSKGEVESDLRFTIDELFADRGLVIAYPQRDVHLNVMRPVEVRLTQPVSQLKAAA